MNTDYIKKCAVNFTWDDGIIESVGFYDLPETIRNELIIYFRELEDLRGENKAVYDAEYLMTNTEGDTLEEVYS